MGARGTKAVKLASSFVSLFCTARDEPQQVLNPNCTPGKLPAPSEQGTVCWDSTRAACLLFTNEELTHPRLGSPEVLLHPLQGSSLDYDRKRPGGSPIRTLNISHIPTAFCRLTSTLIFFDTLKQREGWLLLSPLSLKKDISSSISWQYHW